MNLTGGYPVGRLWDKHPQPLVKCAWTEVRLPPPSPLTYGDCFSLVERDFITARWRSAFSFYLHREPANYKLAGCD